MAHDESTFKSVEIQKKRWILPGCAPFFNKGRGRSIMISYFIACHDKEVFSEFSEEEWRKALWRKTQNWKMVGSLKKIDNDYNDSFLHKCSFFSKFVWEKCKKIIK